MMEQLDWCTEANDREVVILDIYCLFSELSNQHSPECIDPGILLGSGIVC